MSDSAYDPPFELDPTGTDGNLLSGLPSLQRMSRRDQQTLDRRLRALSLKARLADATVAASLIRASYELEKV